MLAIISEIIGLFRAKSFEEMKSNYTLRVFECIAAIPALLFVVTPILSGIYNSIIKPYNAKGIIDSNYMAVVSMAPIIGAFSLFALVWIVSNCRNTKFELRNSSTYCWFGAFVLWMIISTFVNGISPYVYEISVNANGYYYRNENLFTYISYVVIFFAVTSCVSKEKIKNYVFIIISVVSILLANGMIYGYFCGEDGILPEWILAYWCQPYSVFNNLNHYAYFLTVIVLLGAAMVVKEKSHIKRFFYFYVFVLNSIALCINDTMGSNIAVWIGLIFLVVILRVKERKFNRCSIFMLLLFLAISIVMDSLGGKFFYNLSYLAKTLLALIQQKPEEQSTQLGSERIWLWRLTIGYMKEKPVSWLFGFGIEGYGGRMLSDTLSSSRCHNEFLQYMSFFGVPGLVFYVGGCLSVFFHALRNKANLTSCQIAALVASIGYLASSFFGVSVINTAPFLFIMMGFAYRSPNEPLLKSK